MRVDVMMGAARGRDVRWRDATAGLIIWALTKQSIAAMLLSTRSMTIGASLSRSLQKKGMPFREKSGLID